MAMMAASQERLTPCEYGIVALKRLHQMPDKRIDGRECGPRLSVDGNDRQASDAFPIGQNPQQRA
jgi:hypothetical protein